MNILDQYLTLTSEQHTAHNDAEEVMNSNQYAHYNDEQKQALIEQIIKMRSNMAKCDEDLKATFTAVPESDLETSEETLSVTVKYAYCPKCKRKLMRHSAARKNMQTGEVFVNYVCDCGYKCVLDKEYPFITVNSDENNEITLDEYINREK